MDPAIPPNCIVNDDSERIDDRFSSGISAFMIVLSGMFIMPLIMNNNRYTDENATIVVWIESTIMRSPMTILERNTTRF